MGADGCRTLERTTDNSTIGTIGTLDISSDPKKKKTTYKPAYQVKYHGRSG